MTFTIHCIDPESKIFCIIRKDVLSESGEMFKELPIEVYGFLKEMGTSYEHSCVALQNIAGEAWTEIDELMELVRTRVWQID